MAQVVLFHHVQGLTEGVRAFAGRLAEGGHTVHTPDLVDGALPASIEEGVALTQEQIGVPELFARADRAVADLPPDLVFGGFSMGGMLAQRLAQTRPGALAALLYESCVPLTGEWSFGPWPQTALAQVHGMDADPFFAGEGDLEAARDLVATLGPQRAELFLYPGDVHLFTDSSLPSYDAGATALVVERSRALLDRLG